MKKTSKLVLALIAIMMVATLIFAGCSKPADAPKVDDNPPEEKPSEATEEATEGNEQEPQKAEPVTLTFANFSAGGDTQVHLDAMIAAFQDKYPHITIDSETIGYGEYFTQLQTRVASDTAPDCYELNYENFVAYANKDVLLEVEPLYPAANFSTSSLNTKALEAFQVDSVQYGLPASFSDVLLFYNKDLFDEAGADYPTEDWTWIEEQAAAEKIRALGEDKFGIFHPVHFWEFYKVVRQNGGSILNEDKTAFTLNTPQNVETLQFMVDRVQKSNVMPNEAQLAGMGDWDFFVDGRIGMVVTGVWAFPHFTENCEFNWDVAIEPGMKNKATHFFSNGLVINKKTEVPNEAFQWVAFMSASKEAANIRVEAGWELPATTDQEILDKYMSLTPPDNRKAVFDSLDYLVTPPVIEQFAEMADIIGLELSAAAEGAKTPQEALDDAQKALEAAIVLD